MGGYFTIEERKTKEELFPMEIERKFWIDTLPELVELRIRKRVEAGGEIVYQLCVKSIGKLSRHEVETELSRAQFEELASMLDKPLIHKEYHAYRLRDGHLLECSIVDGGVFSYAEVEFASEADAMAWTPLDCLGKETTYEQGMSMRDYWKNR